MSSADVCEGCSTIQRDEDRRTCGVCGCENACECGYCPTCADENRDEQAAPEHDKESWTYLGAFRGDKTATVHGWRDRLERVYYFAKVKAPVVGGVYEVRVRRGSDAVSVVGTVGRFVGVADDRDVLTLEAQDRATELESDRLQRRLARDDALEDAVAPLVALAARTKSYGARQALIAYVTRRILQA